MEVSVSRHPIPYHLPIDSDGFKRSVADGSIAPKQLLVFLSHDVYDFIRNQSREYSPQEIGGVLLGQYCIDNDTRFLIVPTAVACDLGSATPVSIQFPPEFWQRVEEVHTSEFPGLLRIGPYHSHPGYGIHPSGTDRTTILNAFSKPHHISLIYDPHSDQIGFTCWDDGVLKTPSGCFIYEHKQPEDLVRQLMDARPE